MQQHEKRTMVSIVYYDLLHEYTYSLKRNVNHTIKYKVGWRRLWISEVGKEKSIEQ